jgi:exosome complex component RRP4
MSRVKESNDIVTPGEPVFEGDELYANDGVYRKEGKIYSKYFGTVRYGRKSVQARPMHGRYIPEEGDIVIGEVTRVSYSRWTIEFNSPYEGSLNIADATDEYVDLDEDDLTDFYEVGDAVAVKIKSVTEGMDVDLSMEDDRCKKLRGGRVIEIPPSKVPRVIGKKGTMIKQINNKTGCNIIVGQNGQVWIKGDNANLAARTVHKVVKEAHTDGLTDRISEFLEEELEGDSR